MLTSSIFIAEVGEAPDVGKVNSEPDDGKEEVEVAAPCLPLLLACGEHPGWPALHRILSLAALRKVLRGLPQPVGILETRKKKTYNMKRVLGIPVNTAFLYWLSFSR